jgi:hypothetical protein
MGAKEDAVQRVQAYLFKNKSRLQVMSVDMILWEIRVHVAGLNVVPEDELRAHVAVWRSVNGPLFDPNMAPPPPGPSIADNEAIQAIRKVMTIVIDGVEVKRGAGRLNLSVKGVTGELKSGGTKVSANIGWTGTLGLEAKSGDFHLNAELSKDSWSITLSYPDDTMVPDMTRVGKVFDKGAEALGAVAKATADFANLQDAARVKEIVSPHMEGAKQSLEALKGIAKPKPGRVNVGVQIGSPPPMPGQQGIPPGIQGVITLTVVF